MSTPGRARARVAVSDPDLLQRAVTCKTLIDMGISCWSFDHPEDLTRAIRRGLRLELALIGLHPHQASGTLMATPALRAAIGPGARILYVSHWTELYWLDTQPSALLAGEPLDFILSPVSEDAIRRRLDALDVHAERTIAAT